MLINKYSRWYYSIIETRKLNPIIGYGEIHHIIPKALGGSNVKANLVKLSAREHWVCHQLLTRMTEGKDRMKMLHPCVLFKKVAGNNSKRYEQLKIQRSEAMVGRKHSDDTKIKMRDAQKGKKLSADHISKLRSRPPQYFSPEMRSKMSASRTGLKHSEETKARMSKSHIGKNLGSSLSQETRDKISKATIGKNKPKDFGFKISNARSHELTILCPDGSIEVIKINKKQWAIDRNLRLCSLIKKSKIGVAYKGYLVISDVM